jgi:ATP-dependent Lon protease
MARAVEPAYWQNYAALWVPLLAMGTKLEKDRDDAKVNPVICLKSIFYKNYFFLKKIGPQEMGQPVDAAPRCADFLSFFVCQPILPMLMKTVDNLFSQPFLLGDDESGFMPMFSMEETSEEMANAEELPEHLPILPLKNTVLLPGVVIPITVGRERSLAAVLEAQKSGKLLGVLAQRDADVEIPTADDLYHVGTVARLVKIIRMPDGGQTAILQGRRRFELLGIERESPFLLGRVQPYEAQQPSDPQQFAALVSAIRDTAQRMIELSPQIPSEAGIVLRNITQGDYLVNFVANNLGVEVPVKQAILEQADAIEQATAVLERLNNELQLLELKTQIEDKVRVDIDKQQRDYFLNQQLKTIQEELGQNTNEEEINKLLEKAATRTWPSSVQEHFDKELARLRRTNPVTPDYAVTLNYLELLVELPWCICTEDRFDLKKAAAILDEDHFGLEKVKERILEHLAVLKMKGDMKAPILCLLGPPGVGKTSLGKSVAKALGRQYIRMSLGGLHDESEIRGHRRTYIGAMPGRILQSLRKAKTSNPVFILDEIDKVGRDFRGDPSSALLEVLDPEQNSAFYDNYLEQEYDLSKVLFIATANSLSGIQPALLDRMELITVEGYSLEEKTEIAKRHLLPRQLADHGLKEKALKWSDGALTALVKN